MHPVLLSSSFCSKERTLDRKTAQIATTLDRRTAQAYQLQAPPLQLPRLSAGAAEVDCPMFWELQHRSPK